MKPQAVKAGQFSLAKLFVAVQHKCEFIAFFSQAQRMPWLRSQTREKHTWGMELRPDPPSQPKLKWP